jgi:hypothetical protein
VNALSPARYVWRRGKEGLLFLRGKRILHEYSAHYHRARRHFDAAGHATVPAYNHTSFGVHVVRGNDDDLIRLPTGFDAAVERVARSASCALAQTAKCRFFPKVRAAGQVPLTAEIPEVAGGNVITIQLLNPFELDGVDALSEMLLEQVEQRIYGSYAIVDKLYVYRNPISTQEPRASWRWHYDNHPHEVLKVMVYLTDVREDTAPFVYLRETASGRWLPGGPLSPLFGNSRVPVEAIDQHLASGWAAHPVTGRRGTVLIFDDNIVHRATLAQASHRDVIVFQVRPNTFKVSPHIDRRWTGTFGDQAFNADPDELAPTPSP